MSSDIAIKVENLSKCYQIYDTPRDRLKQFIYPKLKRPLAPLARLVDNNSPLATRLLPRNHYKEFWALRDVSFEVKKGETVGIIGRNGSGKSTLLQMICGTLTPTGGSVQTNGRIAALLELGSGFNPEFTGRENVYMNASILGLSNEEIDARFDDIAAFADIGEFIEQPVKTYSSGMLVRLAFAVAINVQPEILVVDEALSVGDELFQRKCFSRIEAIRANGATILFVSHSGGQIVELCDRAILMDAGEKLAVGAPKQIVGRYQKLLYAPAEKQAIIRDEIRQIESIQTRKTDIASSNSTSVTMPAPGGAVPRTSHIEETFDSNLKPSSTIEYESHGAYIKNPQILTFAGEQVNNLCRGKCYRYCYQVAFNQSVSSVRFGMLIKTISGLELGGGASAHSLQDSLSVVEAGTDYSVEFRFRCSLNPGTYFLNAGVVGVVNGAETYLHRLIDIAMFRVLPDAMLLATGIVDFDCYPEVAMTHKTDKALRAS
jgi:lipopolysaccharide transport system ATP-binding protein